MTLTIPANLSTDLGATQAAPVNLMSVHFATGTVYLSDRDRTVGGVAYSGLVREWGDVNNIIASGFGDAGAQASDLRVTIDNTADEALGRTRFSDRFLDDTPEITEVRLYQWNEGGTAGAADVVEIFRGIIQAAARGLEYDELTITFDITDIITLYDRVVGEQVNASDYPDADPDDVGAWKNIIYGSNVKVKCPAVSTGALTSLTADRTSTTGTIYVTATTGFAAGNLVKSGGEIMYVTGVASTYLTVTRGYSGTTAVAHQKGEPLWEYNRASWYLVADHPVKSIDAVYVNDVLQIGSDFTKYTDYTGFMDDGVYHQSVACVKFNSYPVLEQSVDIEITTDAVYGASITSEEIQQFVQNPGAVVSGATWTSTGSVSNQSWAFGTVALSGSNFVRVMVVAGNMSGSNVAINNDYKELYFWNMRYAVTLGRTMIIYGSNVQGPIYIDIGGEPRILIRSQDGRTLPGGIKEYVIPLSQKKTARYYKHIYLDGTHRDPINPSIDTHMNVRPTSTLYEDETWTDYNSRVIEVSIPATSVDPSDPNEKGWDDLNEAEKNTLQGYFPIGQSRSGKTEISVSQTSAAELGGNTVADVQIGTVSAQVDGYADDGSGTYTGTPSAIIQRPDHVRKHFLAVRAGLSTSYIDATTFAAAGTLYASHSYNFAGVLPGDKTVHQVLKNMDEQSRSVLRWQSGVAHLHFRKTFAEWASPSSDATLTVNNIKSIKARRSLASGVVNKVELRYAPDPTKEGDAAYQSLAVASDSASIGKYGERRPGSPMDFFLVRSSTMAEDLAAAYVALYKNIRTFYDIEVFLDNLKLIGFDVVTLNIPRFDQLAGMWAKVVRADQKIGSAGKGDSVGLTVEAWPNKRFHATIAETIFVTDHIDAYLPLVGTISDGINITDKVAATLAAATLAETITVPDEILGAMSGNPEVNETITVTDALTYGLDFYASRDDVALVDALDETFAGSGTFGKGAFGTSSFGSTADIIGTPVEGLGLTDAVTIVFVAAAAAADAPSVADTISRVVFTGGNAFGKYSFGDTPFGTG